CAETCACPMIGAAERHDVRRGDGDTGADPGLRTPRRQRHEEGQAILEQGTHALTTAQRREESLERKEAEAHRRLRRRTRARHRGGARRGEQLEHALIALPLSGLYERQLAY